MAAKMTKLRLKHPRRRWLRRGIVYGSAPVVILGLMLLVGVIASSDSAYLMGRTYAAIALSIVLGTLGMGVVVSPYIERLNAAGPFRFDQLFALAMKAALVTQLIAMVLFCIAITVSDLERGISAVGFILYLFGAMLFGVPLFVCITVPIAWLAVGSFRAIALETALSQGDKMPDPEQ